MGAIGLCAARLDPGRRSVGSILAADMAWRLIETGLASCPAGAESQTHGMDDP